MESVAAAWTIMIISDWLTLMYKNSKNICTSFGLSGTKCKTKIKAFMKGLVLWLYT